MTALMPDTRNDHVESLRRLPRAALWVTAARLKTLSLSVAPVLAGTWIAAVQGQWRLDVVIAAMMSAVAIQIGTNLWNDAADAARGVDTHERLGPPRVTALGLLDAVAVRRAALLAFLTAAIAGLYLTMIGGTPILLAGLLSLAMGYLYSMGPLPLSMTPFGEVLVVIFFGVVAVSGTTYLHTGGISAGTLELGAILGLPAAAVLLINNHRDRKTDFRAGRRTLAILLGESGSRLLYALLLLGTTGGVAAWLSPLRQADVFATLVLAALALALASQMWRTPVCAGLNRLLPLTALFQVAAVIALAAASAS
jgi:1,4-dihydroxy-2-naphthoate polyprenyltransferase